MADRFPLILNTNANQIQEIASGDSLDLTGSNVKGVGILTAGNVTVGAATTDLVVTGDARITGILTIGTSSLKLDGPNNLVNVGTALTLGHTQGLQFHTQNLHSAGFEVNQINSSGIITATGAVVNGDIDLNGDIDVDGHTNLDNVSIAGVTTFAGASFINNILTVKGAESTDGIIALYADEGDDNNDMWRLRAGANAAFYIDNYANGAWQTNLSATATSTQLYSAGYTKVNTTTNGINVYNGESGGTTTINVTKGSGDAEVVCQRTGGSGIKLRGSHPSSFLETTNNTDLNIRRNTNTRISLGSNGNTIYGTTTFTGNIDANGDLDVDGHTNLDNLSVAGVSTFSGDVTIAVGTGGIFTLQGSGPSIELVDANANDDFRIHVNHGIFQIEDATNGNADRLKIDSSGVVTIPGNTDFGAGIDVTGNITSTGNVVASGNVTAVDGTFSGNVSIGGTLTYEDVTNIDSVGIVTARSGLVSPNADIDDFISVGSNIHLGNAGVCTATTFVGALTGNVTGNATSSDTIDITSDGSANTTMYPTFVNGNGSGKTLRLDSGLTYVPATNVLTAGTFSGSGASLTNLNGSNIASGTVPVARIGTGTKNTSTFYRGDGTFATVTPPAITAINNASNNRIVTSEGGTTVNSEANLTFNGTDLAISEGGTLKIGTSANLEITSVSGNKARIQSQQEDLYIETSAAKSIILKTNRTGTYAGWTIETDGDFVPSGNKTVDIGSSSKKIDQAYLADVNCENIAITSHIYVASNTNIGTNSTPGNNIYFDNFYGSGANLTNVNATTLDSIDSGSFLRSDANDTASGQITLTSSSQYPLIINSSDNGKIVLQGSSDPYIRFREGTTDKAYLQFHSDGNVYLWNNEHNTGIRAGGGLSFYDGSYHTVWHAGSDGSGSGLDADLLDGTQGNNMIRSGAQASVSGWHISDYRNGMGNSPRIYFSHSSGYGMHINTYNTSGSIYALELNNNSKDLMKVYNNGECLHGGTVYPGSNNAYDLGTSSARWRNIYTQDLQLSNEAKKEEGGNDVDGTWGSYTIQEGESDLFLINKRNGKKYKFNLTEVS